MRSQRTIIYVAVLALYVFAANPARGDDKSKKKSVNDEKINEIVHRQKGEELKIYMGEKGLYVNGKSVSHEELSKVVRKTKLKSARISAEEDLKMPKVRAVIELLQKDGIEKFTLTTPEKQKAAAKKQKEEFAKEKKVGKQEIDTEKVAIIVHRQKGESVKVYMNSRGAYVNGKSVNPVELESVIKKSGLKRATISAEPNVAKEKVQNMEDLINRSGIKKVVRSKVKSAESKK